MCGIVAILSSKAPVPHESLARATESLRHRGPDEHRCWLSPDAHVALGHARLSIIDLTTGSQPIESEDGTLHLVANGEFYDFERIRGALHERGHRFRTRTDSEIALHLYEEKGAACLSDLRGEFAFAIWDAKRRTLFAARDRFGIKPLFYTWRDGTLVIASEAKALFAAGVAAEWDHESAVDQLTLVASLQNRTLFKGIAQLPAGHYLECDGASLQVRPYWDVDYPRRGAPALMRDDEWQEAVRSSLTEAVRLRLRSDVPVGCYLSGGIDSSAVLSLAAAESRERVAAFTIAFDEPALDESARAEASARHVGADFYPIRVTDRDFADVFADAVWHGETFQYNANGAARFILSREVRRAGYKVVLAGEGADELFAGYEFASAALFRSGTRPLLPAWLRAASRLLRPKSTAEQSIAATSPALLRTTRLVGVPPHMLDAFARKLMLVRSILAPSARSRRRDPFAELMRQFDLRASLGDREPIRQILYLWLKSLFVNYVLAAERLDLAHGVEVRLPFLDHHLFELARNIPVPLLTHGGGRKHLLREAMKSVVTAEVYEGAKKPFFAPAVTARPGSAMHVLVQDVLRSDALRSVPFFDAAGVIALLDRLPAMDAEERAGVDPILLMMASATILQSRYRL